MHHGLYTLRAHGDITKLELEDGVIRGAVASILAEASTIVEVLVDIPRATSADLPRSVEPTPDSAQVVITASSESDAERDLATLVAEVAVVERFGRVDRFEHGEVEQSRPGSARPGVSLRVRADRTSEADHTTFAHWVEDSLLTTASRLGGIEVRSFVAAREADAIPSVSASFAFPGTEEAFEAIESGALNSVLDSDLIKPETLQLDLVTEHRIRPNPNTWE